MAPRENRRARIADAVITVLAERGSRGLTHRAVDEVAELPTGSTSYYLRTRAELLTAAVPRLAELDAAALERAGDSRRRLVQALHDSLRGVGRRRTLARYELVLEAARRPDLYAALAAGTEIMRERLAALFPSSPPAEAAARAGDLLAFIDGLLLANITRPERQRDSRRDLEAALARVLGP